MQKATTLAVRPETDPSAESALAKIGALWFDAHLAVEVSVPHELAQMAAAAWERDETGDLDPHVAALEARTWHRAGDLALLGLSLSEAKATQNGNFVLYEDQR